MELVNNLGNQASGKAYILIGDITEMVRSGVWTIKEAATLIELTAELNRQAMILAGNVILRKAVRRALDLEGQLLANSKNTKED